jgi:DUF1016 N-terminal domain
MNKEIDKLLFTDLAQIIEQGNVRRMTQFADVFPDIQIVTSLMTQLSWTHFIELIQPKSNEAREYYVKKISEEMWSIRETRNQIERIPSNLKAN